MYSQALKKKKLPDAPGVYFFLGSPKRREGGIGRNKKILYIGRATSLRNRVRSYFALDVGAKRSPWIEKMMSEAKSVDFKKTDSVLEAILLEADLIKKFKPPYNTELKDDKSFNCIVITDEEFPRVLFTRQNLLSGHVERRLASAAGASTRNFLAKKYPCSARHAPNKSFAVQHIFGPFTNNARLKTALKIIRKIFPFRDVCTPPLKGGWVDVRPCFNRQIGLCPGVCTGEINAKEYQKHIARLALFLSGKTARASRALECEMKEAARIQEFERAGELKRQLLALKHIQDIALIKTINYKLPTNNFRVEAYDLSHFGGNGIVGAMAVVENGEAKPSEYRLFRLRSVKTQNEVAGLREILSRRLTHSEWPMPNLIVMDGNVVQKRAAERTLSARGAAIPVVAVIKDERHKPREIIGFHEYTNILQNVGMSRLEVERAILLANSEAHRFALRFQKKVRYNMW